MLLSESQKVAKRTADRIYDEYISEEKIQLWTRTRGIPGELRKVFFTGPCAKYTNYRRDSSPFVTALERASFLEQITRRCGATLSIISDMMSFGVLSVVDVPESVASLLKQGAEEYGSPSFSFAFTEQGTFGNLHHMSTTVSESEMGLVLNGSKEFVASGQFLPATFVIARDARGGDDFDSLGMWFVPTGSKGVTAIPSQSLGLEMVDPARLVFCDVALDPSWRIPMDEHRFYEIQNQCRFVLCTACLGLAEAAYDEAKSMVAKKSGHALSYFGKSNGVLLAEMHAKVLSMQLMVSNLAQSYDEGTMDTALAAANKLYACRTAMDVAEAAMSIAGYDGYVSDSRIARIWRDVMGMRISLGSEGLTAATLSKMIQDADLNHFCMI